MPLTANDPSNPSTQIWEHHVKAPNTPDGFTLRTTFPGNPVGVEVMLEKWDAGSCEPAHSHPGDDMTVVVEGQMMLQFFLEKDGQLIPDGTPVTLNKGDVGYVQGGRIHDAKYTQDCKLVYAHNKAFGFTAHG